MSVVGVYRAATHLYPRSFRREYGADMVALFAAQLDDEPGARVVGRAFVDLLTTAPSLHLEAHMTRSSTTAVVIVLAALAVVAAVVGGPVGLVVAAASLAIAASTWRRSRPVVATDDRRWWKLLLGGAGLLASLIVITTATGELPDGGWYVAMFLGATSVIMIAAGVVLGVASRSRAA